MEIWKDIKGYEGLYQVSNLGRIYSFRRPHAKGGLRKLHYRKDGYIGVILAKNKVIEQLLVHRVVAKTFIPSSRKRFINHKDGNKANNNAENLEWCTHKENQEHAVRTGLYTLGTARAQSKLNDKQVRVIKHILTIPNRISIQTIADIFRVARQTIVQIDKGISWKHITI